MPALLALLVCAFSFENLPQPLATTLAPDGFNSVRASDETTRLAQRFPDRRPGSEADRRLASALADELRELLPEGVVSERTHRGRTADGTHQLVTVIAERPGGQGSRLVVLAHRDAGGHDARAELSATAALLELARVTGGGRLNRSITFVSTSGGSGGLSGAREAVRSLGKSVDAVLVLGSVAASEQIRPMVVGTSNGYGQSPLQLQVTARAALRSELGSDPGAYSAFRQGLRMALPATRGEQGEILRAGLPAVLISATGERLPAADAEVSRATFASFGRAVLRTLYALDGSPELTRTQPTGDLVLRGKVVPAWAFRWLLLTLLIPPLITAIDALARARRRRETAGRWLAWAAAPAVPILVSATSVVLLGLTGAIPAPRAPLPIEQVPQGTSMIVSALALAVLFVLTWLLTRPVILRAARIWPGARASEPGAGIAIGLLTVLVTLLIWIPNPYAAGAIAPATHLWLWACAPETGLRRPLAALMWIAGLVLPAIVLVQFAQTFDLSGLDGLWWWVMLLAGGQVPLWSWLLWGLIGGVVISAAMVVLAGRRRRGEAERITVRGPVSYAGPGSLGGTDSALLP